MINTTSLKAVQDRWVRLLLDYRAWFIPESIQTKEWKMRPLKKAIRSCRSGTIDDAEAMLTAFRKNPNDLEISKGDTAYLPIMLTSTAIVDQPPSISSLQNVPYFNEVEINGKICNIRMINASIRAQIAFFATNPDDARSVCQQFCSYMMDDTRRKFNVSYKLMDDFSDDFGAMILENELFPNPVLLEQTDLSVFAVDATIICFIPQVVQLGQSNNIDNGYDSQNGIPLTNIENDGVIVQADAFIKDRDDNRIEHDQTSATKNEDGSYTINTEYNIDT